MRWATVARSSVRRSRRRRDASALRAPGLPRHRRRPWDRSRRSRIGLAAEGAYVGVGARTGWQCEEVAAEMEDNGLALELDVTDPEACVRAVDELSARLRAASDRRQRCGDLARSTARGAARRRGVAPDRRRQSHRRVPDDARRGARAARSRRLRRQRRERDRPRGQPAARGLRRLEGRARPADADARARVGRPAASA